MYGSGRAMGSDDPGLVFGQTLQLIGTRTSLGLRTKDSRAGVGNQVEIVAIVILVFRTL